MTRGMLAGYRTSKRKDNPTRSQAARDTRLTRIAMCLKPGPPMKKAAAKANAKTTQSTNPQSFGYGYTIAHAAPPMVASATSPKFVAEARFIAANVRVLSRRAERRAAG